MFFCIYDFFKSLFMFFWHVPGFFWLLTLEIVSVFCNFLSRSMVSRIRFLVKFKLTGIEMCQIEETFPISILDNLWDLPEIIQHMVKEIFSKTLKQI